MGVEAKSRVDPLTSGQLQKAFHNDDVIRIRSEDEIRAEKVSQISFISPQRGSMRRANVPSKIILNMKAKDAQKTLSEQGKYVTWQEIIYELLVQYDSCVHIGDLGLDSVDQLQTISELIRLQKRIDNFLISFDYRSPCVTLLDLERVICNDYNFSISNLDQNKVNKVYRFQELMIGPLIKNQLIRQMLKIPDEVKSMEQMTSISTKDVFKSLESYLDEYELWTTKNIKQQDFEMFLVEQFNVKSLPFLGIKINNLNALIGSIKNAQHSNSEMLKQSRLRLAEELCNSLESGRKLILKKYGELKDETTLDKYSKISSVMLIEELLALFENLYRPSEFNSVKDFFRFIKNDQVMRDCFQIGLCLGEKDLEKCFTEIKENRELADKKTQNSYQNFLRRIFLLAIEKKSTKTSSIQQVQLLF